MMIWMDCQTDIAGDVRIGEFDLPPAGGLRCNDALIRAGKSMVLCLRQNRRTVEKNRCDPLLDAAKRWISAE